MKGKDMAKAKRNKVAKLKVKAKVRAKARPESVKKAVKARPAKAVRLPKEDLKKYKALLVKEREQVGGDLSHIAQNTLNKSARDASGDLSGYSSHMADQATDDYDRDFSLERASSEQKLLYLIDEAIKRTHDGSYGSCLSCGQLIAKKRLAALPHSEFCIDCQTKKENR